MNIVGVQIDCVWEDKAASHARLESLLHVNPPEPGSLIVLSEMWATGFSLDVPAITETPHHETERFLALQARHYGVTFLGGVVTTGSEGLGRNQCVAFDSHGQELVRYTKIHPFSFGQESEAFERGLEVALFDWEGIKVAPLICYDLRFPEVFRRAVQQGAELFCVIANWPEIREDHWVTLLKARAIENQAYVIGVNRCGTDPSLTYAGRSLIYGPKGEIMAEGVRGETMISARLDRESLQNYRREFPALADIHPEFA